MLNKALFQNKSDQWSTPQIFFDKLNEEFNFTLDVCAEQESTKCERYFTKEQNALVQDWSSDVCFMNPPYSHIQNAFVKKAKEESDKGATVVCLLPARTDTIRFHKYIYDVENCCERDRVDIRFIKGRIVFGSDKYWETIWETEYIDEKKNSLYKKYGKKNSAPFPSMIVIFKPIIKEI